MQTNEATLANYYKLSQKMVKMIEQNFNSKLIERIVDDILNEMIEINKVPIQIKHRSRTVNHLTEYTGYWLRHQIYLENENHRSYHLHHA